MLACPAKGLHNMETKERSFEELTPKEQCEQVVRDLQEGYGIFKHTTDQDLFGVDGEKRREKIEAGRFTTKQIDSVGVYNDKEKARVVFGDWVGHGNLEGSMYTIWEGEDGKKRILRVREQGSSGISLMDENGKEVFYVKVDNKGKSSYWEGTELIPARMNDYDIVGVTDQGVNTIGLTGTHEAYIKAINDVQTGLQKAVITIGRMEIEWGVPKILTDEKEKSDYSKQMEEKIKNADTIDDLERLLEWGLVKYSGEKPVTYSGKYFINLITEARKWKNLSTPERQKVANGFTKDYNLRNRALDILQGKIKGKEQKT